MKEWQEVEEMRIENEDEQEVRVSKEEDRGDTFMQVEHILKKLSGYFGNKLFCLNPSPNTIVADTATLIDLASSVIGIIKRASTS